MKNDLIRLKELLVRDKMCDCSSLGRIISGEVNLSLSKFLDISDCKTSIKVEENGELKVHILISAKSQKTFN